MINLKVCMGTACHIKGSYNVINILEQAIEEYNLSDKVEVSGIFCLNNCRNAISVKINDGEMYTISPITSKKFFKEKVLPKLY